MRKIMTLTLVFFICCACFSVKAAPPVPVPSYPPYASTQSSRYITFQWGASAGATKYELQYRPNNDSFGSSGTFTKSDITDIAYTVVTPLTNCTTYYWRVRAYGGSSVGWSGYSAAYYFRVEESPTQPSATDPVDGAQVTSKRPTFTWTGASGSIYTIQISSDSGFGSLIVNEQTNSTTYTTRIDLSESGTYYWRVKSRVSGCTTESSWTSTRSFTINLNNVLLKTPANNDTISDNTPTFEWFSVDGASKYKMQVTRSSDPSFATPLLTQETTLTSFTPTPTLQDGTYIWRAQSYRNSAWTGVWSLTPYTFTVQTGSGLGEPDGLMPTNDATVSFPLTLSWNPVSNAYSYTLQYSRSDSFTTPTEATIFGTSYNITGTLVEGRWYWRVRANNSSSQSGPWSDPVAFFNVGLPVPIINSPDSPQNGSSQSSPSVVFDWTDSATPPTGYTMQYFTLQYSTSNAYSPESTIKLTTGMTSRYPTTATITLADSTYYWHVKSTWKRDSDATFHDSGWSDTYSFTISSVGPGVPTLSSPINGAVINIATPELKWTTVSGSNITGYRLRYRKSVSNPGDPSNWVSGTFTEIQIAGQATSKYVTTPLSENTTGESYWWSVASLDNLGMTGQWAYPIGFRVDVTPPDGSRITLVSPLGVTVDSGTPTFSWKVPLTSPPVFGEVSSWTLEYATNASFTENVKKIEPLLNPSATISGPDVIVSYTIPASSPMANGAYYWHVAAWDSAGNKSQYSAIGSFTVQTTAPSQTRVSLISPVNGTTNLQVRPTFLWNALAGTGVTYNLQVSDSSSDFSGTHLKINQPSLSATSFLATSDLTTGVYYWRVNSSVPNAVWSDIWVFTVGGVTPPTKILLSQPANGATAVSSTPQFVWQALTGATSYNLYVSDSQTDFGASHLKVNKSGLATTSWGTSADWSSNNPTSLADGTYWWKVTSNVANSDSDVWSFSVGTITTGNTVTVTAQAACSTSAVTGASVVLSSTSFTSTSVTTDASGVAVVNNVPSGTYTLTVTASARDTYTESITVSGNVAKSVSLVTTGNGIIAGVVYFDDVQHPAANITVRIYEQTSGNQAQTVVTSATGEFCALVSKNITYYLVVENYTDQKYEGVTPAATSATKINIIIESKGSIEGVVADQDENVIKDAKVTVRDEKGQFVSSVQTDNKGQFSFKVLPAKYYVEVSKFGYLNYASQMFTVQFKQPYSLGLVKLTPDKGTLTVNLSDKESGSPLDGTVAVQDASGTTVTSISIEEGVGTTEILAATYTLIAQSSGYDDNSMSVKVEGGKQATISIALERAMGKITVTVLETVEEKSQPLAGAEVYIDANKEGTTDDTGLFSMGNFEPNTSHTVKVTKEGYSTESEQVTTEAGKESTLEFTLKKSSPLLTYALYGAGALAALAIIAFVGYKFMSRGKKEEEVEEEEEEEARPQIRRPKAGEHKGGLPDRSYK